jgi:hypothetical protein
MGPSVNVEYVLNEKADGEANSGPQGKLHRLFEEVTQDKYRSKENTCLQPRPRRPHGSCD